MSYQAEASVADGTLTPILSDWAPSPLPVQLVHAPNPQQPLKLRALLDLSHLGSKKNSASSRSSSNRTDVPLSDRVRVQ